jgi:hypothetical protein
MGLEHAFFHPPFHKRNSLSILFSSLLYHSRAGDDVPGYKPPALYVAQV